MSTPIFFKIKNSSKQSNHRILELFFKSWVDNNCNNEVEYSVEQIPNIQLSEIVRVDFKNYDDAIALVLKGIPFEFQPYMEIIDRST